MLEVSVFKKIIYSKGRAEGSISSLHFTEHSVRYPEEAIVLEALRSFLFYDNFVRKT